MALIFVKRAPPAVAAPMVQSGFSWDSWYQKNRQRLSVKRARRYREDVGYRAAALRRSKHQREARKEPVTDAFTVSFSDAATQLDVTVWVLREWRRKDYFPEPHRREGRLWFTPAQVGLLHRLQTFFREHGTRVTESKRQSLEGVVALVYANWE